MSTNNTGVQPNTIYSKMQAYITDKIAEYRAGGLLSKQVITDEQLRVLAAETLGIRSLPESLKEPQNHIYKELEFYVSNDNTGKTKSLFEQLDTTKSKSGSVYLANLFLSRQTDLEILHQRQSVIKYLANMSDTERRTVESILAEFGHNEADIYWTITKKSPEMTEVLEILFFNQPWSRFLNTNDTLVNVYYYFIMIFNPLWGLFGPVLIFLVPYLFTRYIMKVPIPFEFYLQNVKSTLFGDQFFNMFRMAKGIYANISGASDGSTTNPKSFVINTVFDIITSEFGRWLYLGIILFCYAWSIYNQFLSSYNYNKLINFIHAKLNTIRSLLVSVDKLVKQLYITSKPASHMKCAVFDGLAEKCIDVMNTNETVKYIMSCATFTSEPGIFTHKGATIKAYYLLDQQPSVLKTFVELVAYVDAWYSCSGRLASSQSHAWNLATYIPTADKPSLKITSCFSPVCPSSVPNDLLMDDGGNILLTGPNGSGKSTYLKSVMSAVILAQTVGIAPSSEIWLTPFTYLSTYLNIPDCQGKESLFQAEMTRCHDHLAMLKDLESQTEKFSFNIMDEIFVSTNYLEGMSGAYAVIKSLGQLRNSIHIITTHFDKLTSESSPISGYKYKYFTFELDNTSGLPINDYKLRDGINRKHMALHLLKVRGFDPTLVEDAREMYDQLVKAETDGQSDDKPMIPDDAAGLPDDAAGLPDDAAGLPDDAEAIESPQTNDDKQDLTPVEPEDKEPDNNKIGKT